MNDCQCRWAYLQGDGQAHEINHHLLIGQFNSDQWQSCEEQLKVLLHVIFLLTAQIDVSV